MLPSSTVPEADTTTTAAKPLTLSDRCDSCGAQAFVSVSFPTGSDLLFCGHHYRQHETALAAQGGEARDERHRINEKPSISANAE